MKNGDNLRVKTEKLHLLSSGWTDCPGKAQNQVGQQENNGGTSNLLYRGSQGCVLTFSLDELFLILPIGRTARMKILTQCGCRVYVKNCKIIKTGLDFMFTSWSDENIEVTADWTAL